MLRAEPEDKHAAFVWACRQARGRFLDDGRSYLDRYAEHLIDAARPIPEKSARRIVASVAKGPARERRAAL